MRFKTEQYFWTDSNVNVWLKEVTLIVPRMLEIKSQRVLNFKFFPGNPLKGRVALQHDMFAREA